MFKSPATSFPSTISRSREIGHQEQCEGSPVFLVGNCGRREQRREEEHQRQLEHREHQVEDAAEPGHDSQLAHILPAHDRLPGGPQQDEQKAGKGRSPKVIAQRPRGRQNLAGDDRSGKQGQASNVGDQSPRREIADRGRSGNGTRYWASEARHTSA